MWKDIIFLYFQSLLDRFNCAERRTSCLEKEKKNEKKDLHHELFCLHVKEKLEKWILSTDSKIAVHAAQEFNKLSLEDKAAT